MDIRVFNDRSLIEFPECAMYMYPHFSEIRLLKTRISMNNSRESEGFVEDKIGGASALTVSF